MLLPDRVGTLSPAGVADIQTWPETGMPWVRAVMVATADGAARSPQGLSRGISSAADRLWFATIRGLADVILVGAQTIRSEGYGPVRARPELVSRRSHLGMAPLPRLAIVTASGDLDTSAPLFTESEQQPIILAPAELPQERLDALVGVAEVVTAGTERVDLAGAVAALSQRGLDRIVCEGGPNLLGQLAAEGLVDELCLTVTPLLSGGSYGGLPVPRILDGAELPVAPLPVRLDTVLEDSGTLFLRYLVGR